jgi:hypothetical protein
MKTEAKNYTVIFGSNLIVNCGTVIKFAGRGIKKQIIRFREGDDNKILFNCITKDQKGRTVAKIANSKVQYIMQGYKAEITDIGVKIVHEATGDIWLEFVCIGPREFKLNGIFFLPGHKIVATDDYLEVNGSKFVKCSFSNCSAAIGLE